jgi:transcriptional regulator with XRE-family HTH domain
MFVGLSCQGIKTNNKMKKTLSNIALLALRGLDRSTREDFAKYATVHIDTLNRWIRNSDDELTTASNVSYISKVLGVGEQEILENVVPKENEVQNTKAVA